MELSALSDFNLVATHGGFARASRATGRPKATLSRKVSELEAALGVRLIERGSRTLRLTDEGRELHQRTQGPLTEIVEAQRALSAGSSEPMGKLRVSAPVVFAHVILPKIATSFAAAYPKVELEIVAEDRKVDPVEDNYDVVIRINPDPDDRLVGRRVMEDELLLVSPPDRTQPSFSSPASGDRTEATVGLASTPTDIVWRIRTADGIRTLRPLFRLRFSSFLMVRDAVLAGAGVALLPKLIVSGDVASGRLLCWGAADAPSVEIWALQNSRRLSSPRVRAFLDALATIS
jgi:DNA-binding transcriptional LysR family regulator